MAERVARSRRRAGTARAGRHPARRRPGAGRRAGRRRARLPDLHLGHRGPPEGRRAPARIPRGEPAAAGALDGRAAGRPGLVHRRAGLVEVGAQRLVRGRAVRLPRRCCTPAGSTPPSGSSCSRGCSRDVLCMSPTEYRLCAAAGEFARPRPGRRARGGGRRRGAGRRRRSSGGARRTASPSATATARPRAAPSPACWSARSRCRGRWATPMPGVELEIVDGELCLRRGDAADASSRATWTTARRPPPSSRTASGTPATSSPATPTAGSGTRAGRRRHLVVRLPDRAGRGRVGAGSHPAVLRRPRSGCPTATAGRSCTPTWCCAPGARPTDELRRELQDARPRR